MSESVYVHSSSPSFKAGLSSRLTLAIGILQVRGHSCSDVRAHGIYRDHQRACRREQINTRETHTALTRSGHHRFIWGKRCNISERKGAYDYGQGDTAFLKHASYHTHKRTLYLVL